MTAVIDSMLQVIFKQHVWRSSRIISQRLRSAWFVRPDTGLLRWHMLLGVGNNGNEDKRWGHEEARTGTKHKGGDLTFNAKFQSVNSVLCGNHTFNSKMEKTIGEGDTSVESVPRCKYMYVPGSDGKDTGCTLQLSYHARCTFHFVAAVESPLWTVDCELEIWSTHSGHSFREPLTSVPRGQDGDLKTCVVCGYLS